jgi:hypothetical protein
MEFITLENGEKVCKLWYGKIETIAELTEYLASSKRKLETAEGWDISTLRLCISATEFKLRKLGQEI